MASDNQSGNEQMVQLITQQTRDFLAAMKNDISQCKSLNEEDRKNCEAICQRASTDYNQLKMEFLRETLLLMDKALNTSDQRELREIHLAWSLQLDYVARQCENITFPLIQMLEILSRNDKSFKRKYWGYLGGTTMATLLTGTAVGVLIAHCHPGCVLQLAAEAVLFVSLGALAAIAIGIGCLTGVIDMNTVWQTNQRCSDSIRLIINKKFGQFINSSGEVPSESQLTAVLKENLNQLKIAEDIWDKPIVLESFRRSVETGLNKLQETR
jgi:hypothetical protein